MKTQDDKIALFSASLSLTEISLGGILHAFHIPFSGHFLSLNQIAILSSAAKSFPQSNKTFASSISSISALLKSLAPIGKKLTPMLAIAMQGLLFNIGILIFGNRRLGRVMGAFLSSLWSFIQPAIIYTLIFGENIWAAFSHLNENFHKLPFVPSFVPENFLSYLFLFTVVIKIATAILIALFVPQFLKVTLGRMEKLSPSKKGPLTTIQIIKLSLKDLVRPLFLLSLSLVFLLFYFVDAPSELLFWALLRPIACGFLFFIAVRVLPMEKLVDKMTRDENSSFSLSFKQALHYVKNPQECFSSTSTASPTDTVP